MKNKMRIEIFENVELLEELKGKEQKLAELEKFKEDVLTYIKGMKQELQDMESRYMECIHENIELSGEVKRLEVALNFKDLEIGILNQRIAVSK